MNADDIDVLDEIIARVLQRDGLVAWDVDGTLFDPQPRMHKTAEAFLEAEVLGKHVTRAWEDTARNLALDQAAFFAFWHEHFWNPAHFLHDAPILKTITRARKLQGKHNVIITGRHDPFLDVTARQLRIVGIDAKQILTKPQGAETPAFKAEAIVRLADAGRPVSVFVSDAHEEIAAVEVVAREHHIIPPVCFYCLPHDDVAAGRERTDSAHVLSDIANETG